MSKKGLTLDLETGTKKLETFIDDAIAGIHYDVAYSGKFIKDELISISHKSNVVGEKVVDETNLQDSYVLKYNEAEDKIEYAKVEDVIDEIDCGYF